MHSVRNYGVEDGLYDEEFNEGAVYAGADDTLYFGGIKGLVVVHVDALGAMPAPAPVVITVAISIGMATSDDRPRNFPDLLKVADEALYSAKRQGRDCVVSGS